MKKRLHDKKAGIAILAVLFILSLVDVIVRTTMFGSILTTISNYGQVAMTAVLSLLLLCYALKGKNRIFYLLCGAWVGYFVLQQVFALPYIISSFSLLWGMFGSAVPLIALLCRLLGMISIIVIGVLLVKYMNNGTINNKAFNSSCIAAVLMLVVSILIDFYAYIVGGEVAIFLSILDNLSSLCMTFLLAFFAYDSAKLQLKKAKLAK